MALLVPYQSQVAPTVARGDYRTMQDFLGADYENAKGLGQLADAMGQTADIIYEKQKEKMETLLLADMQEFEARNAKANDDWRAANKGRNGIEAEQFAMQNGQALLGEYEKQWKNNKYAQQIIRSRGKEILAKDIIKMRAYGQQEQSKFEVSVYEGEISRWANVIKNPMSTPQELAEANEHLQKITAAWATKQGEDPQKALETLNLNMKNARLDGLEQGFYDALNSGVETGNWVAAETFAYKTSSQDFPPERVRQFRDTLERYKKQGEVRAEILKEAALSKELQKVMEQGRWAEEKRLLVYNHLKEQEEAGKISPEKRLELFQKADTFIKDREKAEKTAARVLGYRLIEENEENGGIGGLLSLSDEQIKRYIKDHNKFFSPEQLDTTMKILNTATNEMTETKQHAKNAIMLGIDQGTFTKDDVLERCAEYQLGTKHVNELVQYFEGGGNKGGLRYSTVESVFKEFGVKMPAAFYGKFVQAYPPGSGTSYAEIKKNVQAMLQQQVTVPGRFYGTKQTTLWEAIKENQIPPNNVPPEIKAFQLKITEEEKAKNPKFLENAAARQQGKSGPNDLFKLVGYEP